jgi:choice-of-anchor A domain-containing protein
LGSNVSGAQATITGTIAVGPLASLDFDKMTYKGIVATDPLGLVTGPSHTAAADIAPVKIAALLLNTTAGGLVPTQTFGEINTSRVITATAPDGMNIVTIARIKLAASDAITFVGGPQDYFIVNVLDTLELAGGSLLKISASLPANRVLINSPNGKEVKLTGGAGIMPMTFLAPRSSVTIGGSTTYTGNFLSGNGSGLNGNPVLTGGNPFGECDGCCN